MTSAERADLEATYERLAALMQSGDATAAEVDQLYQLDDVLRPQWDADQARYEETLTGPASPPRAEDAFTPTPVKPDTFGDTTMSMAAPYLQDAYDLASTAGRRPTYFQNPLLQGVERTGQYVGDMGMAGLSMLGAGMYGGAGLLGEVFGGDTNDERRLARDVAAMVDVGGVLPEGRMLAAIQDARRATPPRGLLDDGATQTTRGAAPGGVGDTAAALYNIGDRLALPGAYRSIPGKPSTMAIPGAGTFEARPINPIEQAAREYMDRRGMDSSPLSSYPSQDPERGRLIGSAYDMMKDDPTNPTVRRAYDAMVQETLDQYNALRDAGIDFKFLRDGMADPYARSPAMGYQDLVENGRLWVFPTDFGYGEKVGSSHFDAAANPLLRGVGRVGDKPDAVANDAFRAVHDTYGHFGPGNPFFRAPGEERAWVEHSRMYSPEARGAMTSETRGQNSWLNFGPHAEFNKTALGADTKFADQKVGLLDLWARETEGMPNEEQLGMLLRNIERWGR